MLQADKSYALITESELIRTIATEYLIALNQKQNIFPQKSLFGKYIEFSNTATPTTRTIVISSQPRHEKQIQNLNLDENLVEFVATITHTQIDKDIQRYLKTKLRNHTPDIAFYYLSAITGLNRLNTYEIDKMLDLEYDGAHTSTERYQTLIDFISNPTEVSLFKLLQIFNEKDHQQLLNCITNLTNDTAEWITRKFSHILSDASFIKSLLKLTLIAIKSKSREEFILECLTGIIY